MFEPLIHTKEFLLNNPVKLKILAEWSPDFALSELAGDMDILSTQHQIVDQEEWVTLGHILAKQQSVWMSNPASQTFDVLSIKDCNGRAIAHELATSQSGWSKYPMSKDRKILSIIADFSEETVAGALAEHNVDWINALTTDDIDILKMPGYDNDVQAIAETIIDTNPTFLHIDIMKDYDFLSIPTIVLGFSAQGQQVNVHSTLAHKIAENKKFTQWVRSDIAQDPLILRLVDSRKVAVAHVLAEYQPIWASTKAASQDDILLLANQDGGTVAQKLATHSGNKCPQKVWEPQYLKLTRNVADWRNRSIAHDLAIGCDLWVKNSEHAYKNEILMLTAQQIKGSGEVVQRSVAELMLSLQTEEIILRVLKAGGCFKLSDAASPALHGVTVDGELFDKIDKLATELIEGYAEPLVKLKLQLSLYSTLVNIKGTVLTSHEAKEGVLFTVEPSASEHCDAIIESKAATIERLLNEHPEFFEQKNVLIVANCEPGESLLNKLYAKKTFSSVSVISNEIPATDNEPDINKPFY